MPKDEEWRAGERVDTKEWLLYGRLYAPASRLDALAALRMSPTMHGLAAAILRPPPAPSSLLLSVHHDTGPWATDASYSADDGMWGSRVLHNFSLVLLSRLKARFPTARCSSERHLIISAFMITSKVMCDDTYSNKSWSVEAQGLFNPREISQMEREMCGYLDWELVVDGKILQWFEERVWRDFEQHQESYPHYRLMEVLCRARKLAASTSSTPVP